MPTDRKKKAAARALAARTGWSYTAALRRLDAPDRPFDMMTTGQVCPTGCSEARHLGLACRRWRPQDAITASWWVRQWASLPSGRAERVTCQAHDALYGNDRTPHTRAGYHTPGDIQWLLALVYCAVAEDRPDLVPGPGQVRALVEADDLEAVVWLLDPLDRAAVNLVSGDDDHWWNVAHPRLQAYVASVDTDDSIPYTWIESEERDQRHRLADRWHRARNQEYLTVEGYREPPVAVPWWTPKRDLDLVLAARHGGLLHGSQVRLEDGPLARVRACEWGQVGPPTGYWVRELEPNPYRAGQFRAARVPERLVPAGACRPEED